MRLFPLLLLFIFSYFLIFSVTCIVIITYLLSEVSKRRVSGESDDVDDAQRDQVIEQKDPLDTNMVILWYVQGLMFEKMYSLVKDKTQRKHFQAKTTEHFKQEPVPKHRKDLIPRCLRPAMVQRLIEFMQLTDELSKIDPPSSPVCISIDLPKLQQLTQEDISKDQCRECLSFSPREFMERFLPFHQCFIFDFVTGNAV